jgi:uncharacterized protein YbbC (DUF1343 family)
MNSTSLRLTRPRVRTGLETLVEQEFKSLIGQRVGLVTNQTGILPDGRSTIDVLAHGDAAGVRLRALFGPEHGVRGDVPAGRYVANARDKKTGLTVYSLYGRTRTPTSAMLHGLDALVFDIQDIGARSYTYLSTLGHVMDACAAHRLPLVVLDRPNPLGLLRVEGGPAESRFRSFVGRYPVSYLHGLTLGELARMINGRGWVAGNKTCDLRVIECQNLTRDRAGWAAMVGLPWVPTSPNVPRAQTAAFYAATGIVGELPALAIGIGGPLPFEIAGAPGLDPTAFVREMTGRAERAPLPGVSFRPFTWTPMRPPHHNKVCGGVQIVLGAAAIENVSPLLTRINFELMDGARRLSPALGTAFFAAPERARMFDLVCGSDKIRRAFLAGASAARLWELWNEGRSTFVAARRPYQLYA